MRPRNVPTATAVPCRLARRFALCASQKERPVTAALKEEFDEPEPPSDDRGVEPYDPMQEEAERIELFARHLDLVKGTFEEEEVDQDWAADTEAAISKVAGHRVSGLGSVECRATLCKIHLLDDEENDRNALLQTIASRLPAGFRGGIIDALPESAGDALAVSYMALAGYELPPLAEEDGRL